MNKTTNYQLNQWEPEDQVRRTDFNEDNAKLDAAIKAVDQKADGKADMAVFTALQTVVNSKGNCNFLTAAYTGTGSTTVNLKLSVTPKLLIVVGGSEHALFAYGITTASSAALTNARLLTVTWTDTGVSWTTFSPSDSAAALNTSGTRYQYFMFY